jgi:hypothetical protein
MEIIATRNVMGRYDVSLRGAEPGAIGEVTVQNTMDGRVSVHVVEVGSDGNATIPLVSFHTGCSVRLKMLTKENKTTDTYGFVFMPSTDPNALRMIDSVTYAAQSDAAQPESTSASIPAQAEE